MPEVQEAKVNQKRRAQNLTYQYLIKALFFVYAVLMSYYSLLTILIVREDAFMFVAEAVRENYQKIQECQRHYDVNFCATQYIPALMEQCTIWGMCMSGNPGSVNRAALFAGYVGKVMNSFCQNMSFQTMIFCLVLCRVLTPLLQEWLTIGVLTTL